jgi:hypothetical protein
VRPGSGLRREPLHRGRSSTPVIQGCSSSAVASQSRDSRWESLAKSLTCRCLSRTTKAPSPRFAQRSSRAIDASGGPDVAGEASFRTSSRVGSVVVVSFPAIPVHPLGTGDGPDAATCRRGSVPIFTASSRERLTSRKRLLPDGRSRLGYSVREVRRRGAGKGARLATRAAGPARSARRESRAGRQERRRLRRAWPRRCGGWRSRGQ